MFGHVDTGKSTLLGHLLFKVGALTAQQMQRLHKEAKECGKTSAAYAFAMDEASEERERGITIDIADRFVEVGGRRFNFLDTPGHADLILGARRGAALADVGVLLVDAVKFAHNFRSGPTREHIEILLAQSIEHIVVAVNKMDAIEWRKDEFRKIAAELERYFENRFEAFHGRYFRTNGNESNRLSFVPISALNGENLFTPKAIDWYADGALIEQIQRASPRNGKAHLMPLRLIVLEAFNGCAKKRGFGIHAKVEGGVAEKGKRIVAARAKIGAEIKAVYRGDTEVGYARAGDIVDITIDIDVEGFELLRRGDVFSDVTQPIPFIARFLATIETREIRCPIMVGSRYTIHVGLQSESVRVARLVAQLEPVLRQNPRFVGSHVRARVELVADSPIALETEINYKRLGTFELCEAYSMIASGFVEKLFALPKTES